MIAPTGARESPGNRATAIQPKGEKTMLKIRSWQDGGRSPRKLERCETRISPKGCREDSAGQLIVSVSPRQFSKVLTHTGAGPWWTHSHGRYQTVILVVIKGQEARSCLS